MEQPNHAARRRRLKKRLRELGATSALITDATNVTWLTGFTGDSTWLLMLPAGEVLISDSRYETQLDEECPGVEREVRTSRINLPEFAAEILNERQPRGVALEAHRLSKHQYDHLAESIGASNVLPLSDLVEPLRAIKDRYELQVIERAIHLAERAFQVIRCQLTPDQSELQIAHNLEHQIRQFGGSGLAFDPIVGVGSRAALPHGRPTREQVGQSPLLLIDWGARFGGYCSDLTRILVTGRISRKLGKLYQLVLDAQTAAISSIRPGARLADVDHAARSVIADGGMGNRFGHGLGHGFGMQIHETPFVSPNASGTLEAGMVITVEPGVYLPDWGGIRIEDDVLVTEDGCRVLSSLPRELEACVVEL